MSRIFKAACWVLAFAVVSTLSMPVRTTSILASNAGYKLVAVTDNSHTKSYRTGARTIEDFFKEIDLSLGPKDKLSHSLQDELTNRMIITIARGVTVTVSVDGAQEERQLAPGITIAQLQTTLQDEQGKALVYDGERMRMPDDRETLAFQTWESASHTTLEPIPFDTLELTTSAVRAGMRHVRQEGVAGLKQVTVNVIYIGGVESRREEEAQVITAPVAHIVDVGLGTLGTTADTDAPDFHYEKKMTMNASAYTAGFESTGKRPGDPYYGITASGLTVERGIVSVDPRVIPLGTQLYVEGYGFSLAADTGGAIIGNKIDLFYESEAEARRFGRKNLTVYVLK